MCCKAVAIACGSECECNLLHPNDALNEIWVWRVKKDEYKVESTRVRAGGDSHIAASGIAPSDIH